MRRAILWLNENGGALSGYGVAFVAITFFVGCLTAAILGYPESPFLPMLLRGALIGDTTLLGVGLGVWGAVAGWGAALSWAKTPPAVKPPKSYAEALERKLAAPDPDPFLVAAQREVEAIAPENP